MSESKAVKRLFEFQASPKRINPKDPATSHWRLKTYLNTFPVKDFPQNKGTIYVPDTEDLYCDLKAFGVKLSPEYFECKFEVIDDQLVFTGKTETTVRVGAWEFIKQQLGNLDMTIVRSWTVRGYEVPEKEDTPMKSLFEDNDDEW